MKRKSVFNFKNIATTVALTVMSRSAFSWFEDRLKRTQLLFDIINLKEDDNTIEADIILKNYSGSLSKVQPQKIIAFLDGELVAVGNVNSNLFILNNDEAIILESIYLKKYVQAIESKNLTYKFIAIIDGTTTDVKAFQSNEHGAVYNELNAAAIKEVTT
jgi:hypothetical protein